MVFGVFPSVRTDEEYIMKKAFRITILTLLALLILAYSFRQLSWT